MKTLENICDYVGLAVDDVDGNLTPEQLTYLVTEALGPTSFTIEQFNEQFEISFRCDLLQYAANAVADADWASKNGLIIDDDMLDAGDVDIDPNDLSLDPIDDDDASYVVDEENY